MKDDGTTRYVQGSSAGCAYPMVVVLDNVRSGHNVGAVFRMADALGVARVCLCGITAQPPHLAIRKTALGAEEMVPWRYAATVGEALTALQEEGYRIVCVERTSAALPLDLSMEGLLDGPTAFVFGHEVWGVSEEALGLADACVEIPQYGHKKSMNVSTCVAIVAWEWRRRR